ncbi:Hypothetical predicted protein [Pelobates cultripes]|uniref:Uncharacterized protein n=1 Tax=Pelobates cultripes TaxID=61616 RepID=A0AAD1S461_PELCU|nr:Hypothetical predicted protein [Pelobates cultripes]
MAELAARAQVTEHKMEEVAEAVSSHDTDLQDLREQLRLLEETNEDLSNRTRRNNILVRGLPESVSTELLLDTLTSVFQTLLLTATAADLLMD